MVAGVPTLFVVQEVCWSLDFLCSQRWTFMWNPPPKYVEASAEEYAKDLAIFPAKYAWAFQEVGGVHRGWDKPEPILKSGRGA